jgi:hypothetical protein
MAERKLPEGEGKQVKIKVPYGDFSTGAGIAAEALRQARDWPEELNLRDGHYGVKKVRGKAGDYVLFTFRRVDAQPVRS